MIFTPKIAISTSENANAAGKSGNNAEEIAELLKDPQFYESIVTTLKEKMKDELVGEKGEKGDPGSGSPEGAVGGGMPGPKGHQGDRGPMGQEGKRGPPGLQGTSGNIN